MTLIEVDVSDAPEATFVFVVLAVDFQIRLYEGQDEALGVRRGKTPVSHPLSVGPTYTARYNNNDGGLGTIDFEVRECRGEHFLTRLKRNIDTIDSAEVRDWQFVLKRNAALSPPSAPPAPTPPVPAPPTPAPPV
ncbi:MAG TPA: hypothetical protein VGK73_14560 [Polyangiaceae bacterium]